MKAFDEQHGVHCRGALPRSSPSATRAAQYALLPRPELLPTALLGWIRRLAST